MILGRLLHLLVTVALPLAYQLVGALELHLSSANDLLMSVGSESIDMLLSSPLAANHANCHMLARLLKYRSFNFGRNYRPSPDWLHALIPFILDEGLEEMLAGILLPLQHLSPTRNAIGWSLIAPYKDRLLKPMYLPGANWYPQDWPLTERKVILGTMYSLEQRHRLSSLAFCKTLITDDDDEEGGAERVWDELFSISADFWRLLDLNCVGEITPGPRFFPLYKRLERLARQGDIFAFFQLASLRQLGGHTSLVEPFLAALSSLYQGEPHKWIMILTDPRFSDPTLLREAFSRLLTYFEGLADRSIAALISTQYSLSTLDLWLFRHKNDDGLVVEALARLLRRHPPKDIIPVLLKRILEQVSAWQSIIEDLPDVWIEAISGENAHWYLPPSQQLFTDRVVSWRAAILTVCRARDRALVDAITLSGIVRALDTYGQYPINLLWRRPLGRDKMARSELIPLTEGLVREAETMLARGEKVKIFSDSQGGSIVKFDCGQDAASIRLFLLGMTVRLAVHAIRMPRLDPHLLDPSHASGQLYPQQQQRQHPLSVRQLVCIDPQREDISEERVQAVVRVIHNFFIRWQMDSTHYNLLAS